jgi:hypothetical protein
LIEPPPWKNLPKYARYSAVDFLLLAASALSAAWDYLSTNSDVSDKLSEIALTLENTIKELSPSSPKDPLRASSKAKTKPQAASDTVLSKTELEKFAHEFVKQIAVEVLAVRVPAKKKKKAESASKAKKSKASGVGRNHVQTGRTRSNQRAGGRNQGHGPNRPAKKLR